MSETSILIVDDERTIRASLKMILEYEGYRVLEAEDGPSALVTARKLRPDLVLLDIKMPKMDGLQVLEFLRQDYPDLPVIILSGHGNVQTAVQATKLGAVDFLEKPPQKDRILLTIQNALKIHRLEAREKIHEDPYRIVGESTAVQDLMAVIRKVAPSDLSVLIRGESGTGKELVARAVHRLSRRSGGPFVQVNCAAIPEDLIENELFGHEKGSYSGASDRQSGKFELAHKGTLFLDEIGDMSLKTQAKVLRALQEGEYQRVGGTRTLHADVRIIAATNQDLEEMIAEGTFREDLYFRINVVPVLTPALRDRPKDLPLLVDHFTRAFGYSSGMQLPTFSEEAIALMKSYPWTGNIRELKNFVERTLILSASSEISADEIRENFKGLSGYRKDGGAGTTENARSLQEFKDTAEKQFLLKKLEENRWNVKATAQDIGTPRSNLYKRMQHFGIKRGQTRS